MVRDDYAAFPAPVRQRQATVRRFSKLGGKHFLLHMTCERPRRAEEPPTSTSARPVFFTAMTARMERMRQASATMLMMPEVKRASTVSTSPEKRTATSPGFCATRVLAGRRSELSATFRNAERGSFSDPKSTSSVSCAEDRTPSNARLPK